MVCCYRWKSIHPRKWNLASSIYPSQILRAKEAAAKNVSAPATNTRNLADITLLTTATNPSNSPVRYLEYRKTPKHEILFSEKRVVWKFKTQVFRLLRGDVPNTKLIHVYGTNVLDKYLSRELTGNLAFLQQSKTNILFLQNDFSDKVVFSLMYYKKFRKKFATNQGLLAHSEIIHYSSEITQGTWAQTQQRMVHFVCVWISP